ncbi:MAG: 1-acyl-sn-glycerol-3-phosphate acyltransferase [Lachnospiraceae bacterium]|nr:1-acyl-sn-glycerol-3-phosphate acyltransferase [Lachnospiraceae bacterium]
MNRIVLMCLRNFFKVPPAYLKLCHYAKHTEKYPELEKYRHIQYIFKTAVKSGNVNLKVYGAENIPKENGFMIYSNHQGMFDILAIPATCEQPLAAVLKKELKDIPFLKQVIACTKSFPMDREDVRQSMEVITATAEEVKKGRNYLIFPEGTRSKNGNQMIEFHAGSFKIATKAKCPIVPVALIDCYKVFDEKGSKPVSMQIHYLKPIPYDEYKEMKTPELAAMVHDRIEECVNANSRE